MTYFRSMERLAWGQVAGPAPLRPALTLLGQLLRPGEVVELRVSAGQLVTNGYFNDPGKLAQAFGQWADKAQLAVTVNPVRRDLLAAAPNKLRQSPGWLSGNRDIARYAALVIRCQAADDCQVYLRAQGWPEPIRLPDGLLYAVNLPCTRDSTALIQQVQAHLAQRFEGTVADEPFLLPVLCALHSPSDLHLVEVALVRQVAADATPNQAAVVVEEPVADDALTRFVREECVLEAGVWTPTGKLYGEYDAFCYVNEVAKLSAPNFSRTLAARYGLKLERRKVQGVVTRGIRGIRLRN